MSDEGFDVIVVGAGPAGSIAAYELARKGYQVALLERGAAAGAKNVTGGRMYSHALRNVLPEFRDEAPLERQVTVERITFLGEASGTTLEYSDAALANPPYDSYTLLRADFDAWLASKAEEAGAFLATGVMVDDLLIKDGAVVGVRAGEDEMEAKIVLAADGVNSLLAQKAGLRGELRPAEVAVGAKEIIELGAGKIEDRFGLESGSGAAQLYVGDATKGIQGGGFLYTNKETVSLGVVVSPHKIGAAKVMLPDVVESFRHNPQVQRLLAGGKVVEYSGHLIPEAGVSMMPKPYRSGFLVLGDAAGLALNTGYTVRGIDFAIGSGHAAAEAAAEALQKGDVSEAVLAGYLTRLRNSFVLGELQLYRDAPSFMEADRIYAAYPQLVEGLMRKLFMVDGTTREHLLARMMPVIRQIGLTRLGRDAWRGVHVL